MRNISSLVLVIAGVVGYLTWPNEVSAQQNQGTITITNVGSPVKGQISASGTYTVPKGWTISSIKLIVWPVNGGPQQEQAANYGFGGWDAKINGLTSGVQYNVEAQMLIMMGGTSQTDNSAIQIFKVK